MTHPRHTPLPLTPDPRQRAVVPVLTCPPVQGAMEAILRAGQWPQDEYGLRRYVHRVDGRESARIVYQVILPPDDDDRGEVVHSEVVRIATEELAERILADLGPDAAKLHRAIAAWVAVVPEGRDAVISREQVYSILGLYRRSDLSRREKDQRCWAAVRQIRHIGLAVVHLTHRGKAVQYDAMMDHLWDIALRTYGQRRLPGADGGRPTVEEYDEWQLLVRPGRWGQRWVWGDMRQVGYMPRAALVDPDRSSWPRSLALESLLTHRARVSGADRVRVTVREVLEAAGVSEVKNINKWRQMRIRTQVLAAIEAVARHGWVPDYGEWPAYLRPDAGLDAADQAVMAGDGAAAAPVRMPRGWWDEFLQAVTWYRVPPEVAAANRAARGSLPPRRQRRTTETGTNELEGSDLRRIRLAKGWTQAHLAAMIGITQAYLSQLESGARRIPRRVAETVRKFAMDEDGTLHSGWAAVATAVLAWWLRPGGQ